MSAETVHPSHEELYTELVGNHGFRKAEKSRTPGYSDCVEKDGVEVSGIPFPQGLRVDVHLPVTAREDTSFRVVHCAGATFLSARGETYATRDNFSDVVRRTVELAGRGSAVMHFNQDKLLPYWERKSK